MSTQLNHSAPVRTYRGRSLEELIPRIRAELGSDAIILREREGLTGGFNGFFAQRCVEVDAQAAPRGIDLYDDEEEEVALPVPGLPVRLELPELSAASARSAMSALSEREPKPEPEPEPEPESEPDLEELTFSQRLALARRERAARTRTRFGRPGTAVFAAPSLDPAPAAPAPRPPAPATSLDGASAGAVARELIGHGISETWAHELIVTAAAHLAPFAPGGSLREGVRAALAGCLSPAPSLPSSGAAVAVVGAGGAGKTRCAAALAAAYARASTLRVTVASADAGLDALLDGRDIAIEGRGAAEAVAGGRDRGLVVVDTVGTSPADARNVVALADELDALGLDAVYLAVPATLSASAARGLLEGLRPLAPSALVVTHADETDELGTVTELAYLGGLPIAFIHGGLELDGALDPGDPAHVAARVLP